jgi:hypothetical protein
MRRCEHSWIVESAENAAITLRSSCLAGAVGWAGAHLSGPVQFTIPAVAPPPSARRSARP